MNNTTIYKDSPLGKIPNDWEVKELGQICRVNQGLQIPIEERLKEYEPNSKIYITIQYLNNGKEVEYIKNYNESVCCIEDDILMTRTGNTGIVIYGVNGVFHNNFFKIKYDRNLIDRNYLIKFLQSNKTQNDILVKAGTSTIPDLNHKDFYKIKIIVPPLPEQTRLATLLTTWDHALKTTQSLIEHSQLRKKWLMQQLLTGKKRLNYDLSDLPDDHDSKTEKEKSGKSFNQKNHSSDNWKEVRLGDIFQFVKSYSISRDGLSRDQGNLFCIHYGDIHAFYETEFLNFKTQKDIPKIIDEKINIQEKDFLKEGDVIIADASEDYEGVGEAIVVLNIDNKIAVGGLHTIVLRDFTSATTANFRGYLFDSEKVRNELRVKATGTSVYSVTKTTLESIILNLPPLSEQTAIAQVLQTADKEIQLLKAKAEKLKKQKKGLMQILLTGKKRLNQDLQNERMNRINNNNSENSANSDHSANSVNPD